MSGPGSHEYRILLQRGQVLRGTLRSRGIGLVVELLTPAEKPVLRLEGLPGGEVPIEPLIAEPNVSGAYRLRISFGLPGEYSLSLAAPRPISDGDRVQVSLARLLSSAGFLRLKGGGESLRQAAVLYRDALKRERSGGDDRLQASTYYWLGRVYQDLNEHEEADRAYLATERLLKAVGGPGAEALATERRAQTFYFRGDFQRAVELFRRSLEAFRRSGNRTGEAEALGDLAVTYKMLGDNQKALEADDRALARFRALERNSEEGTLLHNIGQIYLDLGRPREALARFREALALQHGVPEEFEHEASTLSGIGEAYFDLGDIPAALENLHQSRKLVEERGDRRVLITTLTRLGVVDLEAHQVEPAMVFFQQALALARKIGDKRFEGYLIANIGWGDYLLGRQEAALQSFAQGISILQAIGDLGSAAEALFGSARVKRSLGRAKESRADVESSLKITETLRAGTLSRLLRSSFFSRVRERYDFYIELLMDLDANEPEKGWKAKALEASERARARSVLDELAEAKADIRAGVSRNLLETEEQLLQRIQRKEGERQQLRIRGFEPGNRQRMVILDREMDDLASEHDKVQAEIRARSPRYAALVQPQPRTLREIQRGLLDRDSLLLSYWLGEARSFLWLVSRTGIESYELPARIEVEKVARNLWEHLDSRRRRSAAGEVSTAARRLSRDLLAPLEGRLRSARLLIIADGALQYVPFAALPDPVSEPDERAEPLLVRHEIVQLPSASAAALLRRELSGRAPAPKTVAVFADPVFQPNDIRVHPASTRADGSRSETPPPGGESLPRLEWSRKEALAILSLVPKDQRSQAFDFDASLETATSPELSLYRMVHFATHSRLDERPELSGIYLSLVDEQGLPRAGFLHALEVYNLQLRADLVVLSACQTALGDDMRGEGIGRLTRGFLYAGAKSVVVSLWSVSDRATAELMARFYEGMLRKGLRPAAALRDAQLEIRRQRGWEAPFYWAGFVLQGDWQ